ncbi:hypothetical protein [Herbaspirillum huttiense]|uniref:hypothetical protein n=1 Tax=Herbaspirillum huttiense TaxID=863372 RepID=UPI0006867493|nr:hypothetical protein [Herbaspirillum huttiense]
MQTILRYFSLLALISVLPAYAEEAQPCDQRVIATVAHWAGIKGKLISRDEPGGLLAATACKAMPHAPTTTIVAIAFDTDHPDPGKRDGNKVQQVVAMVEDGKVVAAARSVVEEDAATLFGSYRIDTAPYILSPTIRAFGVLFQSSAIAPSFVDASAENELTLWIRDGDHLRAVFGTNVSGWVAADEVSEGPGPGYTHSESADMTVSSFFYCGLI